MKLSFHLQRSWRTTHGQTLAYGVWQWWESQMFWVLVLVRTSGYVLNSADWGVSLSVWLSCFGWTGPLKASNSVHYHTILHLWNMIKFRFPHNQPGNPKGKIRTWDADNSWFLKPILLLLFPPLQRQRGDSQRTDHPPGKKVGRLFRGVSLLASVFYTQQNACAGA